jgi:hypothetical protein
MRRIIHLRDISDTPTPSHDQFPPALLAQGRAALEQRNLRYDNATGRIYDASGLLENLVNQSDHKPHDSVEEVMRWEFRRYINNSASRIQRGYTPWKPNTPTPLNPAQAGFFFAPNPKHLSANGGPPPAATFQPCADSTAPAPVPRKTKHLWAYEISEEFATVPSYIRTSTHQIALKIKDYSCGGVSNIDHISLDWYPT